MQLYIDQCISWRECDRFYYPATHHLGGMVVVEKGDYTLIVEKGDDTLVVEKGNYTLVVKKRLHMRNSQ